VREPRIQYAKTIDGARIACAGIGEGKPLLLMPFPPMSWLAGWSTVAPLWTPLAESHRLVMYDPRGCGFSDRDAIDFSMDAMLRDLDVVAASLGSEPFALIAVINAVPVGLTFAARHPAKISHLIVCDGRTDFSDWAGSPVQAIEASLRGKDWTLFAETHARILWGSGRSGARAFDRSVDANLVLPRGLSGLLCSSRDLPRFARTRPHHGTDSRDPQQKESLGSRTGRPADRHEHLRCSPRAPRRPCVCDGGIGNPRIRR
jgi:pimeloyl-ACP methyl ester carboxylesterase